MRESQAKAELYSGIGDSDPDDVVTESESETFPEIPVKKATATSKDDATAADREQPRAPAGSDYDFDKQQVIASSTTSAKKVRSSQVQRKQPKAPDSDAPSAPSAAQPVADEDMADEEEVPQEAEQHIGTTISPDRLLKKAPPSLKRNTEARPDPYDMQDDDEPVRTSNPHKKHRGMPKPPKTNDEDEEDAVAATPAKKQRGRPKMIEASDEEDAEEEIVVAKPAQKRKGLPKAAEPSDDDADELAALTPKTKKPKKALRSCMFASLN